MKYAVMSFGIILFALLLAFVAARWNDDDTSGSGGVA